MLKKGAYVSPLALATWFINHADRDAGEAVTHLKLQKLIYYAEAWFLANFDQSLTNEKFQAWAHGPVSPTVYAKYRDSGWDALSPEKPKPIPENLVGFLSEVYEQYGQLGAKKLEALTHKEDPWKVTRGGLPPEAKCTEPIDRLLMRNFYAERIGKKRIKTLQD
ncbi:Panacea domain-containing protein [Rhizobium giardinii]|uniref:Putative phage-associated protein n=1 Tax=Rhizobium giardinii TaxID=56731 RepID=A0A7W8U9X0_9HYPH|nr:type II toxin-antitoxin system antitoxin SocA domain-containing protein [Rhizobium giardinii]MBB5534150.1 putative phage-associated protein [Rhizobium giardinii]